MVFCSTWRQPFWLLPARVNLWNRIRLFLFFVPRQIAYVFRFWFYWCLNKRLRPYWLNSCTLLHGDIPQPIKYPKGTHRLEAPASDPVYGSFTVLRLVINTVSMPKDFISIKWHVWSLCHLWSSLQIGDSRLKSFINHNTFWNARTSTTSCSKEY